MQIAYYVTKEKNMNEYTFIVDSASPRMNYVFSSLSLTGNSVVKFDDSILSTQQNFSSPQKAVYIFSPTYKVNAKLLNILPSTAIIFCGKICLDDNSFQPQQIIFTYLQDDNFVKINSKITSEGALQLVISNTSLSLFDSNVLILGYGNLARQLAADFSFYSKKLAVATYSKKELQDCSLHYTSFFCTAFLQSLSAYDVVINTIPAVIFNTNSKNLVDKNHCENGSNDKLQSADIGNILNFKRGGLLLDLASISCLEAGYIPQNIDYIQALGLPDKTSPESAGKYITKFVLANLKKLSKQNAMSDDNDRPDDISNQDEISFLLT